MSERNNHNEALAYLINGIRHDWDRRGIRAQLDKLNDRPLDVVCLAAITAAVTRRDQRTPAIIAANGSHWHDFPQHVPTEQPPRALTCPEHRQPEPCRTCRAAIPDAHTRASHAQAARAAIRPTTNRIEGDPR